MHETEPLGCTVHQVPGEKLPIVGVALETNFTEYQWLLAHCDDGVTWGYRRGDRWKIASDSLPDLCPQITSINLQQLRLFGNDSGELLAWRVDGGFQGRTLQDEARDLADWAEPMTESRVLVGDRKFGESLDGFTVVGDGYGSRHAVPIECTDEDFGTEGRSPYHPLRMTIKHYFNRDEQTGVVRIAASRLVSIRKERAR
jgi:CRISPR-associated protein (TIGR03984 family)